MRCVLIQARSANSELLGYLFVFVPMARIDQDGPKHVQAGSSAMHAYAVRRGLVLPVRLVRLQLAETLLAS